MTAKNPKNKEAVIITEITGPGEIRAGVDVIRRSFQTVAAELNLTKENCPTNPAFIQEENLESLKQKGTKLFGLFRNSLLVGFVAVEKAHDALYYMEKLAVLPEYRHQGLGRQLVDFVFDYVKRERGLKVSIGIIAENIRLKNWYQSFGFRETGVRNFVHLPFTVCFMEKILE